MYEELIKVLEGIEDDEVLIEAEARLSQMEDAEPELLKAYAPYMLHLPQDHSKAFRVCVLGSDGHAIAHMIDLLYTNASIVWIANIALYDESLDAQMDYLIISEKVSHRILTNDQILMCWGDHVLNSSGRIIWRVPFERSLIGDFYNFCNFRGYAIESLDSNDLAIVRKVHNNASEEYLPKRYKTIYVVCPASRKSGGPELLHQLVYHINRMSGNARIAYINTEPHAIYCHPEYADYAAGHLCLAEDIEDRPENAVVIPEGWNNTVTMIKHAAVLFWWLSVDNFIVTWGNRDAAINKLEQIKPMVYRHLVQSAYARSFLLENGVPESEIYRLSDYINAEYLDHIDDAKHIEKEDIVLYNPYKGAEYVQRLVARAPDLKWRAIKDLTTAQVGELLRRAKVYIDFGNHPGKDRIPREAAASGCIVITGRRGSAAFREDVPIPEKFRLSEENNSLDEVISIIRNSLADYDKTTHEFDEYRQIIGEEKKLFLRDIRSIFFKANTD